MLGLPKQSEIKKIITKNELFDFLDDQNIYLNKQEFNDDIKRITLVNQIRKQNDLGQFLIIYVVLISLKRMDFNEKSITMLYKLLGKTTIFILEYEEISKLAILYGKIFVSEWKNTDEQYIKLDGVTFNDVWENIVIQIGNFKVKEGRTLSEQIEFDDKRRRILMEIEQLDNMVRKEKQPNKKFYIAKKINKLREELED